MYKAGCLTELATVLESLMNQLLHIYVSQRIASLNALSESLSHGICNIMKTIITSSIALTQYHQG